MFQPIVTILKFRVTWNTHIILPPKNENFHIKNSDVFRISAQNIESGYLLELPQLGTSNEYSQSIFWAEIRKIMYTL